MGNGVAFPSRERRRWTIRWALVLSDLVALLAATTGASLLRFGKIAHVTATLEYGHIITFFDLSVIIALIWLAAMWAEHLYDLDRVFWGTAEYSRVARALSLGVVAFILATYLLKLPGLSRGWTMLAWGLGIVFTIGGRSMVRLLVTHARRAGRLLRPTLIVGANDEAEDIVRAMRRNKGSGLVPVACLATSLEQATHLSHCLDEDVPCVGYAGDIRSILTGHFIDTVVIVSTAFPPDALPRIINDLRDHDVDIQMSSGLLDVTASRVMVRESSGIPFITIKAVSFSHGKRMTKRVFDLIVGGTIVLLGLPIWLALALAIKLESRGPVFYRQQRVGRGGTYFDMFKFRSMCDGADARLDELTGCNEATGPLFKMKNDPRLTRVGKWMRKFSVDEFPQLLNVLRGEMSLVGPRPPLPFETEQYDQNHWRRMEVLPGMTGLWQVSGRSSLTFDEMVRLDLFYIENWSVGFDLSLLLRTIPAVVFARGAY